MRAILAAGALGLTLGLALHFARAQAISGGTSGGGASCSGDLNTACTQVTATHLAVPLPIEQGGWGKTTGVSWTTRRFGTFICGASAWIINGLTTPTPTGTAAAARPNNSGPGGVGQRCFIKETSVAAGGSVGGLILNSASNLDAMGDIGSRIITTHFTDTALTTRRIWIAVSATTLSGTNGHTPPTGSAAFATTYAGFGFDPAVNGGRWVAASGDGTNETGTDTGVTVAVSTLYTFDIDLSKYPTSISFGVNGTYITKTTNLPLSGSSLYFETVSVTSAAVAVVHHMGPYEVYE